MKEPSSRSGSSHTTHVTSMYMYPPRSISTVFTSVHVQLVHRLLCTAARLTSLFFFQYILNGVVILAMHKPTKQKTSLMTLLYAAGLFVMGVWVGVIFNWTSSYSPAAGKQPVGGVKQSAQHGTWLNSVGMSAHSDTTEEPLHAKRRRELVQRQQEEARRAAAQQPAEESDTSKDGGDGDGDVQPNSPHVPASVKGKKRTTGQEPAAEQQRKSESSGSGSNDASSDGSDEGSDPLDGDRPPRMVIPKKFSSIPNVNLLNAPMIDVMDRRILNNKCNWTENESKENVQFMKIISRIMKKLDVPWFMDEGGLIGVSRAGALANADDDFDFFAILPNQITPCRPDSLTCTEKEYNAYIHKFLMNFWREGMCINKFDPDPTRFESRNRLMFSLQMKRDPRFEAGRCFRPNTRFAHMHLGLLTPNGEIHTNIWAGHTTHKQDKIPLDVMLPVTRCRAGPVDAPCPRNISGFLTVRNQGEYRKRSSDGSCLIVRRKWGIERKKLAAKTLRNLHACGYNSIIDLLPELESSGYKNC